MYSLKFYKGSAEALKLKVRRFWELISTFVEVTGFLTPTPSCQFQFILANVQQLWIKKIATLLVMFRKRQSVT